jgi:tetratricopeptide (TPR) repeat protein
MKDLDKDLLGAIGRATHGVSREWENPLRQAFQRNQDHLLVGLFLHDCLSDANKPAEAAALLMDLQRRFNLHGAAADYCGGIITAHRLCLEQTRHPAIQDPQSWLTGLDDMAKCHTLACAAGTILSSPGLSDLFQRAVGWCESALEIYPYDFYILALKATLLVELENHEEAVKIFNQLKKLPPGTREANFAMAGRALLEAKVSGPSARRLLRRALKQEQPPWMARQLAGALAIFGKI